MIYEIGKRYIIPFSDMASSRAEMPEISVDERRGNFIEVVTGFPEAIAVSEAKRCLSCRRCLGCGLCWAECEPEAIDFSIPDEELTLEFDEVILANGQETSFSPIPSEFRYGKYANVITDIQFERMLSLTGPTDGMIVSPLDGEIPNRIAVVQGHPEEGDEHLLTSLVLGVNESILALHRIETLQVILISPICQSFKEKFLSDSEKISGLCIKEGWPESVDKSQNGNRLNLTYSKDGHKRHEPFDLIVILTKSIPQPGLNSLSQKLASISDCYSKGW
jgi:heterodisulfide reductase subunit A-like polyferredoxin